MAKKILGCFKQRMRFGKWYIDFADGNNVVIPEYTIGPMTWDECQKAARECEASKEWAKEQ